MARIRAIKPEFWSSPNLPADPWTRLLYIAMWNWADDNGVGTANPRELLGFAFPNDDQIDTADIRRMLGGTRRDFGVKFYTVGGRPYYSIPSWREHQKFDSRAKGKHPGPEKAETWLYQDEPDDSAGTRRDPPGLRRDVVAGTGEQGNRGTGEKNPPYPPALDGGTRDAGVSIAGVVSRLDSTLASINATGRSEAADQVARAYAGWLDSPIDAKTHIDVAQAVDELLRAGIDPHRIAEGIKAWHRSDSWSPTQIRRFVTKAAPAPSDAAGKPTRKAATHRDAAELLIAEMKAAAS